MLLLRRHPRFIILLSSLLTASLLLLLSHSPFATLQPTSRKPLKPPTGFRDVAARVQRAERAYQKMLLGRDALIAKVGPAPRNVALFVLFFSSALANTVAMVVQVSSRRGALAAIYHLYVSSLPAQKGAYTLSVTTRGLFSTRVFLPT